MRKINEKVDKSDIYNGFSGDISVNKEQNITSEPVIM